MTYTSAMLDYFYALGMVILVLGLGAIPLMALGLYFSRRIQSRAGRVLVVWPLFALGSLALCGITLLLAMNVFGVIRMFF